MIGCASKLISKKCGRARVCMKLKTSQIKQPLAGHLLEEGIMLDCGRPYGKINGGDQQKISVSCS